MRVREAAGRSVTATARRAQIMAATIETIAELGYRQASFARIAERAEISSTRLISYHFSGKEELMRAVIAEVSTEVRAFMSERLRDLPDERSALLTYIRSRVELVAARRMQMDALMSIFLESRGADGERSSDSATERRTLSRVQDILEAGQRSGEFRTFDSFVMASTIERSVDGLPFLLRTTPDLDLSSYAAELTILFDLATRNTE